MVSSRSPSDVLLIKFLLILPTQALQMYMEIMAFSEAHEAAMKDFIVSTSDQQQAVADSKPGCLSYPHTILELSQVITNICADIVQKVTFQMIFSTTCIMFVAFFFLSKIPGGADYCSEKVLMVFRKRWGSRFDGALLTKFNCFWSPPSPRSFPQAKMIDYQYDADES